MKQGIAGPCAVLLAAVCGQASAQSGAAVPRSTVDIYGVVDASVEIQKVSAGSAGPAVTRRQLVSGTFSASRFGLRGTEDLGGGLRAFFGLEHGFNVDDGNVTGPAYWGRKSIVGLGGAWGDVSFGRDYTPAFWAQFYTDVNGFAMYGNSGTMSAFAATGMLRANNGVYYASPEMNGFRGRFTYTFGDESATAPTDAGRIIGVSGEYRSPTLSAGAFHQLRRTAFPANGTTSEANVYQGITGLYNFGQWAVSAGLTRYNPAGPNTATSGALTSLWSGVILRFQNSDLRINLGRVKTDVTAPTDGRSTLVGINYSYYLSKRTNLYLGGGRVNNNASAQFGLEGGSRGIPNNGRNSDTTVVGAGIRHTF